MLFEYPHKYYKVGYYIFILFELYALYIVHITPINAFLKFFFIIVIIGLYFALRGYYLGKIYLLKSYNIQINSEYISIYFDNIQYSYTNEELQSIYFTEQFENIKVYKILHIYTKDDKYFYFSNELINFQLLNKELKKLFPRKYHHIDHLLKNFRDPDEGKLYFEYLKNKKS